MLLFRSEEHVNRWCRQRGVARGEVFTPEQMWAVARPWYGRRLARDWQRLDRAAAQRVFDDAGLRGPFWELAG